MEGRVHQGMLCPVCQVDLMMTSRQGVEIDYCPRCRGVWLDRGELDKIAERTQPQNVGGEARERRRYEDRRGVRDEDEDGGRGSWLDDLFNFGD